MMGKGKATLFSTFRFLLQSKRIGDLLVARGALSEANLHIALAAQRGTGDRLGQILVRERLVAPRIIYSTLAQQWTVRALAAAMTCVISFSGFTIRDARAGIIDDVPGKLSLVGPGNAAFTPVNYYPQLFGTEERSSSNISPFTKWTGMFVRFDADAHKSQYHTELANWRAALQPLAGRPLREQVERVNAMMNSEPYIEDSQNYASSDLLGRSPGIPRQRR